MSIPYEFLSLMARKMPGEWHPHLRAIRDRVSVRFRGLRQRRRVLSSDRVVFHAPEVADVESYEYLAPGRRDVHVAVDCNALSFGTEQASLVGLLPKGFPYWPGYSGAGVVLSVGKQVSDLRPGDRVAGQFKNARHVVLDQTKCFLVPSGVSTEEAAFLEIGIIVLQAIRKARIQPGESVLVLGQGIIGQMAVRLAVAAGGCPVMASATSAKRREISLQPGGADRFLISGKDMSEVADVVIEASGARGSLDISLRAAKRHGRIILLGSARGAERLVEVVGLLQGKGVQILGAHVSVMPQADRSVGFWPYRDEGTLFLDLLASGRLQVASMITHRWQPEEVNRLYEDLIQEKSHPVGGLLVWNRRQEMNSAKV